jgi:hypothetical protein
MYRIGITEKRKQKQILFEDDKTRKANANAKADPFEDDKTRKAKAKPTRTSLVAEGQVERSHAAGG